MCGLRECGWRKRASAVCWRLRESYQKKTEVRTATVPHKVLGTRVPLCSREGNSVAHIVGRRLGKQVHSICICREIGSRRTYFG